MELSMRPQALLASVMAHLENTPVPPALHLSYGWLIIERVVQQSRTKILSATNLQLNATQQALLTQIIERLKKDEPLQYIIGHVDFLDVRIKVNAPVLIPRPETEQWLAHLISTYRENNSYPHRVLDIGTGSGCIALSLAYHFPQSTVVATDIQPHALALATENRDALGLSHVYIIYSDLYQMIPPDVSFDLIVANPPYIAPHLWETLEPSVKHWEDVVALQAEDDGLKIIQRIIAGAPRYLAATSERPAELWMEIDPHQQEQIATWMQSIGFYQISFYTDLTEQVRVVRGLYGTGSVSTTAP